MLQTFSIYLIGIIPAYIYFRITTSPKKNIPELQAMENEDHRWVKLPRLALLWPVSIIYRLIKKKWRKKNYSSM